MSKTARIWVMVGSALLLCMSALHLSGLGYMSDLVVSSDLEGFIKEVFPVLFIHPSLHLLIIGLFGMVAALTNKLERQSLAIIGLLASVDALLALYLGAWVPASLLIVTVAAYQIALRKWSLGTNGGAGKE